MSDIRQEHLLTEFQERNMGRVRYFNQFQGADDKRFPLGVVRNEFDDVISAWYLQGTTRIYLKLHLLVHVDTLRATRDGGPCNVWSFASVAPQYQVHLSYEDIEFVSTFYAVSFDRAVVKARYMLACEQRVPIQIVNAWFTNNPSTQQVTRIPK